MARILFDVEEERLIERWRKSTAKDANPGRHEWALASSLASDSLFTVQEFPIARLHFCARVQPARCSDSLKGKRRMSELVVFNTSSRQHPSYRNLIDFIAVDRARVPLKWRPISRAFLFFLIFLLNFFIFCFGHSRTTRGDGSLPILAYYNLPY